MNQGLANQINNISKQIKHMLSDEKIVRSITFGSKLVANTVVLNLALNLSLSGENVLIVDLVPGNKAMYNTLQVDPKVFLEDIIEANGKLQQDAIINTKIDKISILSTNQEGLNEKLMNSMLNESINEFDYILINENHYGKTTRTVKDLGLKSFKILTVDQQKSKKRQFVKFLNSVVFHFDSFLLVE